MIWLIFDHFTGLLDVNIKHLLLAVTQSSPISHPQISGQSKLMLCWSFPLVLCSLMRRTCLLWMDEFFSEFLLFLRMLSTELDCGLM